LVVARAKRLGFDAEIIKLAAKAKENEQSLREKRYEALSQASLSFGSSIVCCAHHRDDNAEGFLMALFGVGGGALGAAMASYEKINGLSILRPFVELSKEELRLPLSLSGYTDFVVDNFDQELVGQRAFLRHMVLPKLSHFKPNISERLNHFAKEERYSKEALLKQALPMIDWCENGAKVVLAKDSDPVLLKVALKHILNKMSSSLDLRQCRPTLEKMITHSLAGLDRAPKLFILNDLNAKVYKLPGALAYANGKEILVRRV
jgi:tRNA(Ile)-lysidine synthase TilS/MesJ